MDSKENIIILRSFVQLKNNWNQYGAKPLKKKYIESVIALFKRIEYQPEVFPTGRRTVLGEYDKSNGDHLSFEYKNKRRIDVLIKKDSVQFMLENINEEQLIAEIKCFYR